MKRRIGTAGSSANEESDVSKTFASDEDLHSGPCVAKGRTFSERFAFARQILRVYFLQYSC